MQPRYIFVTVFSVAFLIVTLVLIGAKALPPGTGPPTIPPADNPDAPAARVEVQDEAAVFISTTTEPAASQVTPPQDGLSLLEDANFSIPTIAQTRAELIQAGFQLLPGEYTLSDNRIVIQAQKRTKELISAARLKLPA